MFFRARIRNTGPISETKVDFELFARGIFIGKNFCLRFKSLRVLAMKMFLFSFDSFSCLIF